MAPDTPPRTCRAVVSQTARTLDVGAAVFLANMAELFVMELERKWALATPHTAQLHRPVAAYHAAVLLVDAHKPGWPVLLSSTAAASELGACARAANPKPAPFGFGLVWCLGSRTHSVCGEGLQRVYLLCW